MAYSDYGAFVYCNGKRRTDKEDVALFASDEETFGEPSDNLPSGARIWVYLYHTIVTGRESSWLTNIHHGIMGDGNVRVMCHKQGLPKIYELTDDGINEIKYGDGLDHYHYGRVCFAYKDYEFVFCSGQPYEAKMLCPDGSEWECYYDYEYGAGFEEE